MSVPPSDTPVGSFEVRCRVGQFVMDSDDPDHAPDLVAVGGRVTIEPDLNRPIRVNESAGTRVVGVDPLEFTIDAATGQLVHPDGDPGVELIDPTDEHLDPQGWTYTATVRPAKGRFWTVTFGAPADGSVVDLGSIASVAPSPGITANYLQQTVEARDQAESFAVRAEAAATEAEGYAPTFAWDGTALSIDGGDPVDLKGEQGDGSSWAELTGKPETYPSTIPEVGGLQAALPRIDTTVGTRVFVGDVMIYGETGKQDITERFASGLSPDNTGRILIFRRGSRVVIEFTDALLAPGVGSLAWTGVLDSGWRPHQGSTFLSVARWNSVNRLQAFTAQGSSVFWTAEVTVGANVASTNTRPAEVLRGQIEYDADGWPVALPGTDDRNM